MKKNKLLSSFNVKIPFHPWVYFGFFLTSLSLLSYFSLSTAIQLWVGLFGLTLPLLGGFVTVLNDRRKNGIHGLLSGNYHHVPTGIWILFFILFLGIHFYRLSSFPFWPLSDEGIFSSLAIGLTKKWEWTLLWSQGQMEPLLLWLLSLFFRISGPSLLSLRLFTVIFSVATALAAYGAARIFLSSFLSFVFCWLFSFSFWEIAMARQCTPNDLIPFFQLISLVFLGIYFKKKDKTSSWLWILVLGLWCGLGFYTYVNWVVIWLFLLLLLLTCGFRNERLQVLLFIVLSVSMALPLMFARMAPGGMDHIHGNFANFSPVHSIALYFRGLFWDGKPSYPLGPIWGGYLDAATGSLALTGLLYLFRHAGSKILIFLGAGFFLSLLPGLLTNNMELQRVSPSLAFFVLVGMFGVQGLLEEIPSSFQTRVLSGLLLVPVILNAFHFFGLYGDTRLSSSTQQWRNVQYYDAYNILSDLSRREGPLYIFSEFNTDYDNKTLGLACYPFDAVHNPSLYFTHPHWAALITNLQYTPYFIKNFPGLRFYVLKTDKIGPNDPKPFGIFLIPTSRISPSMFNRWMKAEEIYQEIDFELQNKKSNNLWESALEAHFLVGNPFPTDPFFTVIYWEKTGFLKFLDGHFIQATEAYRKAISQGIPAAHLYYDLGVCLKLQNRVEESEKCFEKAADLSRDVNQLSAFHTDYH